MTDRPYESRIKALSPSTLKQAKMCEARTFAKREDEDFDDEKGDAASAGTLAHKACEIWYRPNPAWLSAVNAIADPAARYQAWIRQDVAGVPKHPIRDAEAAFNAAVQECASRGESPVENSALMDARAHFQTIISQVNRDVVNVVFAERRYKGNLVNGVPVSLIIDLGIDRGNGKLEIVDWKTGMMVVRDDDLEDEDQVLLNLCAVRFDPTFQNYNTITFSYFWVRHERMSREVEVDAATMQHYLTAVAARFEYLRQVKEPKESLNQFCGSCGRRHKCDKYRRFIAEAMTDQTLDEGAAREMNDDALMEAQVRVGGQFKKLETMKKMLAAMVSARVAARNGRPLHSMRFKTQLRPRVDIQYNPAAVVHLAQMHGVDFGPLLTVRARTALDAFADKPGATEQLRSTATRVKAGGWIEVSPIRDGAAVGTDGERTIVPDVPKPEGDPQSDKPKKKGRKKKGGEAAAATNPVPPGPGGDAPTPLVPGVAASPSPVIDPSEGWTVVEDQVEP